MRSFLIFLLFFHVHALAPGLAAAGPCAGLGRAAPASIVMKGKRKGPGQQEPRGGGNPGLRKKLQKRDFQERSEWALVCRDDELGAETGSTKAVQAGVTPQGQDYIWTLVRGSPRVAAEEGAAQAEDSVFATDGACRYCQFPLINGETTLEADNVYALRCGLCGTQWSLLDGKLLDLLPGDNPVRWAAKLANEKKGEQNAGRLPTRVSRAGRVYVRLPDGTLLERLSPSTGS
jgi:nitrite reductase/ring-hydroxylating ferredoxin subunit